ncbi:MAG: hypothetical protein SFU86_07455 [Pirellulaceae bacterium]|nr:hypothetical protein [Pirellulaceae bacterium]
MAKSIEYYVTPPSSGHRVEVVIGTTTIHGAVHETDKRPFLRPTAVAMQNQVARVMTAPIGGTEGGPGFFKIGH